jgi:hypothetical protein
MNAENCIEGIRKDWSRRHNHLDAYVTVIIMIDADIINIGQRLEPPG